MYMYVCMYVCVYVYNVYVSRALVSASSPAYFCLPRLIFMRAQPQLGWFSLNWVRLLFILIAGIFLLHLPVGLF